MTEKVKGCNNYIACALIIKGMQYIGLFVFWKRGRERRGDEKKMKRKIFPSWVMGCLMERRKKRKKRKRERGRKRGKLKNNIF